MNDEILIRKYTNRRFYCVPEARYVSLTEIGDMVRSGRGVRVVEKTTGNDITRYVLMQVLLEDGADNVPVWFYRMMLQSPPEMLEPFFGSWFPMMFEWYLQLQQNQRTPTPMAMNPWGQQLVPGFPGMMMPFFPGQAMSQQSTAGDPVQRMEEILRRMRGETDGEEDGDGSK